MNSPGRGPARLRLKARLLLAASIILSAAGFAAFYFLFRRGFNVYWLILSSVILPLYQAPAVLVFSLYRRTRQELAKTRADEG